ncbi:putative response regulatory protein [compost metagenome]
MQSSLLLLIQVDSGDSALLQRFEHDSELLHFSLINICNEFLLSERRGIAFKHWGASMEILILIWEQLDRVPELISQINQGIFHTLQRKMHFGVSSIGEIPRSLPAQYSEAVTALRRRNLLLPDLYIHSIQANTPGAGGGKPHISFTKVQEDWKIAVLSGNRTKITSASQGWIDLLRSGDNLTPELLETWRADILNFRAGLLREMISGDTDLALEELESYDLTSPSPSTSSYTFSQFAWRDWSDKLMNRLAEVISKHQAPEKKTINDIVKYIEQNYQSELSLQDISSHFFVSREYISRKFKQDFGINFSDYLSNYRIDKAKQLMLNPHLRVQQIADMVGIHDVKYFSKVFKKQVGLSPREYRSNLEV